jgi:hypothetical protein
MGIKVEPQSRAGLTLGGVMDGTGAAVIHVEQHADDRPVGGLSVLVINR